MIDATARALPAPLQSTPATKEVPGRGKNRFSLDALRLPFLSSPRKATAIELNTQSNPADSKSHNVGHRPSMDSTNRTVASADPSSPTDDTETAPASAQQESTDTAPHRQLAPPEEVRPKRSALSSSADASSRRASRTMSPHRVSFSPSTEEVVEAREQAQSLAALGHEPDAKNQSRKLNGERHPRHPSKHKSKPGIARWRGLKSRSTSDLVTSSRRSSLDSTLTTSSGASFSAMERFEDRAALQGAAAVKRRMFRWDRKGIHHQGASGKGKTVKAKITKHQAMAARHAKTLEQVINAGMGLHPIPSRGSSMLDKSVSDSPDQPTKGGTKNKLPRAKPIPMVKRSQLRGLKSALLDVDLANSIIGELRAMPVPLEALRSGLGKMVPDAEIGTAGEHGQERILTANLPDAELQASASQAVPNLSPAPRPPLERKAKSAAEQALRNITLQAQTSAPPQKAVVSARTSSLPSSTEESATPTATEAVPAQVAPLADARAAPSGVRPLKMVCLDCGELEAHRRHAQRSEAAQVVTSQPNSPKSASTTDANTGFSVATVASGAAAALAGVGALVSARSVAANENESTSSEKEAEPSARPSMFKSMSLSSLPALQDGQRLMGSTPLQLLLDPVGTVAQNSGAFNALADVSGAVIRATQDMSSIHPPIDRMAIFVHWWGFEITLPKASMAYLGTAHSVSGAFLSFLQTMAVGGGVPELLPFIKYISTFMEVEYKAIQAQDHGHGVCIAGTWFMPLALVPRPWDYPLDGTAAETPSQGTSPPSVPTTPASLPVVSPRIATAGFRSSPEGADVSKKQQIVDTNTAIARNPALEKGVGPLQPVPPKRNLSPSQKAAIHSARTEKIPHDLSPRHSRSSSIASAKSAKLHTDALGSVQEMPELGSVRVKA